MLDLQTYARFDSATGPGITNSYDALGRMLASTNNLNGTRVLSYAWDAGSRRTGITHPSGYEFSYAYDAAGLLTGITDVDAAAQLFSFSYDARHRINIRTDVGAGTVDHGFDRLDRLSSLAHTFTGGTGNVSFTYGYNPASQMETRTRSNDAYAWTGGVNVSRAYAVNALNQYTSAGTATFTHDRNGNLTGDGSNSYVYDVENRPVSASGAHTQSLRYDLLGRLYEFGATGARRFLWNKRSPLVTRDQMFGEEGLGSAVGEARRFLAAAFAHFSGKTVILAGIIVQRHARMIVQPFMHLPLRLLVDEAVLAGDVEHQRPGDGMLLAEQAVYADAVIAH